METKRKRGSFATMNPERQREIASMGGKAAHARGNAHEWNHATAKIAGKKGGLAMAKKARERDQAKVDAVFPPTPEATQS